MDLIKDNYLDEVAEVPHKKLKVSDDSEKPIETNGDLQANDTKEIKEYHISENENHLSNNDAKSNSSEESQLSPNSNSSDDSTASESDWQSFNMDAMKWVQKKMMAGLDPRDVLKVLAPGFAPMISSSVDTFQLWKLIVRIISEPDRRNKLADVNTFQDAVNLIKTSKKILVLTGAGVSVSCGIPDFRSRDGVYARLAVDFPDLPNPEAMFDISYFKHDPRPFFKFAKEIYPGQFKPSLIHRFIRQLEKSGRLLRNYTQNIDTLEQVAGINKVIQCHGSFATASCQKCERQVDSEAIRQDIFNQVVPHCKQCTDAEDPGIIKPDIVFFGEDLPVRFHHQITEDKDEADLLIVIGSSLKVRPVALIPSSILASVPQILINRESLQHLQFDVELLGDGDIIVAALCEALGGEFSDLCENHESLKEITKLPEVDSRLNPNNITQLEMDNKMQVNGDCKSSETNNKKDDLCPSAQKLDNSNEIKNGTILNGSLDNTSLNENKSSNLSSNTLHHNTLHANIKSENPVTINEDISSQNDEENAGIDTKHLIKPNDLNGTENERNKTFEFDQSSNNDTTKNNSSTNGKVSTENVESNDLHKENNEESGKEQEKVGGEEDLEVMRGMWKSKWKQSISSRLPRGCYYFNGEHRYVFPGAEAVYEEYSSDEEERDSSDESDSNHVHYVTAKPQVNNGDDPCCSTSIQSLPPVCGNVSNL